VLDDRDAGWFGGKATRAVVQRSMTMTTTIIERGKPASHAIDPTMLEGGQAARLRRIRQQIAEGTYLSAERLEGTIDALELAMRLAEGSPRQRNAG
jgi:hypothetical protein